MCSYTNEIKGFTGNLSYEEQVHTIFLDLFAVLTIAMNNI